jgi:hypothetical protein
MGRACGTYGGEEECLQNFERKNYRSVHLVMLNVAVMHPVVRECMHHKVFSPFFCRLHNMRSLPQILRRVFLLHVATIRVSTCIKQPSAKHTVTFIFKTHTRGPEFCAYLLLLHKTCMLNL